MDGTRVSDFSIERILSPELGLRPPVPEPSPEGYLQQGLSLDPGRLRPPAPVPVPVSVPVPVPVPGCLQYRGLSFGEAFYPYGLHRAELSSIYPSPGVCVHVGQDAADVPPLPGYHGYHHAELCAQPRQRPRMRTVFTDAQAKRLEALFDFTDYPAAEARAEVARSTGLSEETVRVWFKNRRARRKRQRSGSKVKSPSPPSCPGADRQLFTSFL